MFNLLDEDNLRVMGVILDRIKALKILKEHGVTIGNLSFNCDPDMETFDAEDFGDSMLAKMIGEYGVSKVINGEEGDPDYKDYDPEEVTVWRLKVVHPVIQEYYKVCRELGISCMTEKYSNLVMSSISTNLVWCSDYNWYDFYIPNDESLSFILIYTDCMFFNSHFVESYYKIIDYCKDFVERSKSDGELNKEQCSN